MTATFIHRGDAIDYTPEAAVSAGDVVVQGDIVGVAKLDIKAGALGALAVSGVFDVPKPTGTNTAISAGAKVYWDAENKIAVDADGYATASGTGTASDMGYDETLPYLGKAVQAAGDDDETVRVLLSQ